MDRIDTRSVRPLVQANESVACLQVHSEPIQLELIWLERTGGTFGPGSAAFANQLRRSIKKHAKLKSLSSIRDLEDRGQRTGLLLYLSCPICSRRCRVLYSRKGENRFGCVKCNRPAYRSNCWPYTGRRNARGISLLERERLKQEQLAKQISEQLSGDGECLIIGDKIDKHRKIKKPENMSQTRFKDLMCLLSIRKQLALVASLRVAQHLLSKDARN
jgi:hypothetical protein